MTSPGEFSDVRMRGFQRRARVEDAWAWIDARTPLRNSEVVSLSAAAGRVLAADIRSDYDVPGFDRAMMDGYAVQSADTDGATPYDRRSLRVIGTSLPGRPFENSMVAGSAVRIMTGAPLPKGADAVLPAEQAEETAGQVQALGEVTPGKHVGRRGEDITAGSIVLSAGRVLRPQDLGLLSSIGIGQVAVIRRPRVSIVVTGNELLPAGSPPRDAMIADANGPMLAALVARDGGQAFFPVVDTLRVPEHHVEGTLRVPSESSHSSDGTRSVPTTLTPDDPDAIRAALLEDADITIVSGGSSVGEEDHAPRILNELGELAFHGLAMRPSSPTGMGVIGEKLVFLLPGNPVSCLCGYDFFAGRALRRMGGLRSEWPYRSSELPLARKLVSQVGRVDYARVRVSAGLVEPIAISGASLLSSTTVADGFVLIPADSEGYAAGERVTVCFYDVAGTQAILS